MTFLHTLLRPDHEEQPERAEVGRAANLLQIGEFQFLQLAYREWHREELPPVLGDRLFDSYMLRNQVPHWARHHARRIIELDQKGLLTDSDPLYHRYDANYIPHVPHGRRRFAAAVMVVAGFLCGGILVGHYVGGEGTSVLPPYFDRGEVDPQVGRNGQ